jgi:hypothetical protein
MQGHLEIVWKFGAPGVSGVHSNEDAARVSEGQLGAFELKGLEVRSFGALDRQNLLGDHTKHLQGEMKIALNS